MLLQLHSHDLIPRIRCLPLLVAFVNQPLMKRKPAGLRALLASPVIGKGYGVPLPVSWFSYSSSAPRDSLMKSASSL